MAARGGLLADISRVGADGIADNSAIIVNRLKFYGPLMVFRHTVRNDR